MRQLTGDASAAQRDLTMTSDPETIPPFRAAPISTAVLEALADPLLVIDEQLRVHYLNPAAEQFVSDSAKRLKGRALTELFARHSPLFGLLQQAIRTQTSIIEHDIAIEGLRIDRQSLSIEISPLDISGKGSARLLALLRFSLPSLARKLSNHITQRHAARSVTAMAGMLMHEVKNPLSGIRGAAQLLEQSVSDPDRPLTRLIVDEADRIIGLVDGMSVFSDGVPVNRSPLNIHAVLDHAKQVAANGFARACSFVELYDPSLPPVAGDRDLLVQVFLNLLKNAAEAMSPNGGEIQIQTAYRHGVRLAVPGIAKQVHLPLQVTIRDVGGGIPADLVPHLFEPFVTTKNEGTGLGLALVAKVIGDHGGVIECDSVPGRTEFRIFLPRAQAGKA